MIKGSIQRKDITFINIYAPSKGAIKHTKQILTGIKGEIDGNTIMVRDFNTSFTSMDRSSRQKINKAKEILSNTIEIEQLDFIDIFRTLHPKQAEYTFFKVHMEHSFQVHMEHSLGLTIY